MEDRALMKDRAWTEVQAAETDPVEQEALAEQEEARAQGIAQVEQKIQSQYDDYDSQGRVNAQPELLALDKSTFLVYWECQEDGLAPLGNAAGHIDPSIYTVGAIDVAGCDAAGSVAVDAEGDRSLGTLVRKDCYTDQASHAA